MEKLKQIIGQFKSWAKDNPNKAMFFYGFCCGVVVGFILL